MTTLSKSLFELANIMQKIEENEGEITNDMLPVLTQTEITVCEKIDAYVYVHDNVLAQIEKTKKTIEKFKKNLGTWETLETRLKDNVKHLMKAHNIIKIDGNERSIKLVKSGGIAATEKPVDMFEKIEIVNEKYLSELACYVESKIVLVLKDKEAFKKAIHDNKIKSCFELPRGEYVKFT